MLYFGWVFFLISSGLTTRTPPMGCACGAPDEIGSTPHGGEIERPAKPYFLALPTRYLQEGRWGNGSRVLVKSMFVRGAHKPRCNPRQSGVLAVAACHGGECWVSRRGLYDARPGGQLRAHACGQASGIKNSQLKIINYSCLCTIIVSTRVSVRKSRAKHRVVNTAYT